MSVNKRERMRGVDCLMVAVVVRNDSGEIKREKYKLDACGRTARDKTRPAVYLSIYKASSRLTGSQYPRGAGYQGHIRKR
jgi:hypothetical protein